VIATVGNGIASSTQTFNSSAYSTSPVTVSWTETLNGQAITLTNGETLANGDTVAITTTQAGSNTYLSTLTFTTTTTNDSGAQFQATFTTGTAQASSNPATMTVVSPVAPSVTTTGNPTSQTVITGQTVNLSATVVGNPLADGLTTTNWQVSNDSINWTNVNTSTGSAFSQVQSYTSLTTGANAGLTQENTVLTFAASSTGTLYYRAYFSNAAGSVDTSSANLTVLTAEPAITQWNFSGTVAAPINSPAPTLNIAPGTLSTIGMATPADDELATAGTLNTGYSIYTLRIRGTGPGGADTNGWTNSAAEYTQGIEIDVNTTGYKNLYATLQWYSTTQGIRDMEEQYNTNINNAGGWTNIADLVTPGNDYYGAIAGGTPSGVFINLTGITGANNDPNFGIRLVAAYDSTGTLDGEYASAALSNGNIVQYNGTSGNWRFGDISINGVSTVPAWLSPGTSTYTWNSATETLTVTSGTATIIGDPAASGDSPVIDATGATSSIVVDSATTNTVHIGGLNLSGGATASMTAGTNDVLIVAAGGTFSIASGSTLNINNNFVDLVNAGSTGLSAVDALLASGYKGGSWTGTGITSSNAAGDNSHLTAVAAATGLTAAFDGISPNAADVLLRYTYYGDANLNGSVDGSDYSLEDFAALNGLSGAVGWVDFNGDGIINGSDYTLLDNAYNTQGPQILPAAQIAKSTASAFCGYTISAVPSISELLKKDRANVFASNEDVIDELGITYK
jgi:hypothetical protein